MSKIVCILPPLFMRHGTVHEESFSIPLRFLSDNKHNITELRTYLWLRSISIDSGGYTPENYIKKFKRNTRERIIPKLIKKGWVTKAGNRLKITSVYKLVNKDHPNCMANNMMCKLDYSIIPDKNKLKKFIFAMIETYIMQGKYISENKGYLAIDRETKQLKRQRIIKSDSDQTSTKKVKGGQGELKNLTTVGKTYLTSRLAYSIIEKWGYSNREISRLRKDGYNRYGPKQMKRSVRFDGGNFYSFKHKAFFRFLPTQVIVRSGRVFYKKYNKYSVFFNNNNTIATRYD